MSQSVCNLFTTKIENFEHCQDFIAWKDVGVDCKVIDEKAVVVEIFFVFFVCERCPINVYLNIRESIELLNFLFVYNCGMLSILFHV